MLLELANSDFHPIHPLIALEHLSLYIQKHLGQLVAVYGKVDHGRSWRRWTTMGNNGQQSAVLHASLMLFLF